jgi:hypothetical protein
MPLKIETFTVAHGGNAFFKAVSHPLVAEKAEALLSGLKSKGRIAVYDPLAQAEAFSQFYDLAALKPAAYYVQDVEKLETMLAGVKAQPVTALAGAKIDALFVTAFDAAKLVDHIRHLLPAGIHIASFDDLRLPPEMLADKRQYLSPMNFATNFVFFRDDAGHHTRLVTANYWGGYGAKEVSFWCRLYDGEGKKIAEWQEKMGAAQNTFVLDSKEIRARFSLPAFTGQLFVHAVGVAGHDIVKYALDTYGDDPSVLSCTHDANSWPSDYYAGLPAPDVGEEVVLWVQNSMPFPIPANEVGLNIMGEAQVAAYAKPVAAFATVRLSVTDLLPKAQWPQQVEVTSGKYFVRPRYEVFAKSGRQRLAHVNVERSDLKSDPNLSRMSAHFGKGHILPSPILPMDRFESHVLPTPMVRGINTFPLKALLMDASGEKVAELALGNLPRNHKTLLDTREALGGKILPSGHGHIELVYDFDKGSEADGWMHGLFRFIDRASGHAAESSFGSHMFNGVLTYRGEPQSYAGRAPGLSTRLFLRLGQKPYDTHCHLIYPASTPWHETSATDLILTSGKGEEVARSSLRIPCGGSHYWQVSHVFDAAQLAKAGEGAYVIIRDTTCRLFGYHGLLSLPGSAKGAFSLDHMFGF